MTFLLDTHVWLWSITEPDRIAPEIREIVEGGEQPLALSAISPWEAVMLHDRGRFFLGDDPIAGIEFACSEYPLTELPITREIAVLGRRVDIPQQDPADRFLAATAIVHGLTLLTHDAQLLAAPGVPTLALG